MQRHPDLQFNPEIINLRLHQRRPYTSENRRYKLADEDGPLPAYSVVKRDIPDICPLLYLGFEQVRFFPENFLNQLHSVLQSVVHFEVRKSLLRLLSSQRATNFPHRLVRNLAEN